MAVVLLASLLLSLVFSGCGNYQDEELDNQIKNDVYSFYEDLQTFSKEANDGYAIIDYLYDWGEESGFVSRKLSGGNLMITKPASVPDPSFPYTILQCSVNFKEPKLTSQKAAIALAVLANLREHGKVSVLFTLDNNGDYSGARRVQSSILDSDYFINLDIQDPSAIALGSPFLGEYRMTLNYSLAKPSTTKAYRISITGLPSDEASNLKGPHPNPVVILSNLLTVSRANGLIIELADFEGGTSSALYPQNAAVIVCVEQNSDGKFIKRFTDNQEDFYDKYGKELPDATYEMEEVPLPEQIIDSKDSARILSLLYTSRSGIYGTTDEDGNLAALTNIGRISTSGNRMLLDLGVRSLSEQVRMELKETYQSAAYLSQATFKTITETTGWPAPASSDLSELLADAADEAGLKSLKIGGTFKTGESVFFYEKRKDIDMITFLVNNNDSMENAKTLLVFLTSLVRKS